jgi:DeoR/GlpR family transcriptional regulator of sugar metabolism
METSTAHKQLRLKQKDLVLNILRMFSEELEKEEVKTIWEVSLSSSQIIQNLKDRCNIDYKTDYWLWTQLKRYEEELNMPLFKKQRGNGQEILISLFYPYTHFHQKKHLYISEKLKVANGVYDEIQDFSQNINLGKPVKLVLGAGGLCNHIASIFAEHKSSQNYHLEVYTHNLGVIEQFSGLLMEDDRLSVFIPKGKIDSTTYTLLDDDNEFYGEGSFDFIVQGTSFIYENNLYVESEREFVRKKSIAKASAGVKILVLSGYEVINDPSLVSNLNAYANLFDYDQVIVPRNKLESHLESSHNVIFEGYKKHLKPLVLNWNYEIYQILKS